MATFVQQKKIITMDVKDSNGNVLEAGDSVILIKSLKVKGLAKDIKQGTVVKNIRLTNDDEAIEGKIDGTMLVLKTCFVKKK
jgi:protein PhnA